MNTNQPSSAGARLGAGVFVSLITLAAVTASCAAPPTSAGQPRPAHAAPTGDDGVELRIRIARSITSIRIDGGQVQVSVPNTRGQIRVQGPCVVTRAGDRFVIAQEAGTDPLTFQGPLVFASTDGTTLRVDDGEHLGMIELRAAEAPGAFDAIEQVGIESYLPGVIAAELYPGWSPVAYEAQSITARSYALHERARQRAAGNAFDLENTTIDQAYAGAKSSPKARDAVAKTRGVILRFQGEPLRAYYSSACGGRPSSASDTWPTDAEFAFNLAPPLQSRQRPFACGFSHHFNWQVTRDTATLAKRLAGAGKASGDAIAALRTIESIEASEWNAAGRPAAYEVIDASGTRYRLQADTLRHACNASVEGLADVPREQNVRSGDIDILVSGDLVQITGRGFGHGVGMCQFGAEGFARRGWSRDRILSLYYPGAQIFKAY